MMDNLLLVIMLAREDMRIMLNVLEIGGTPDLMIIINVRNVNSEFQQIDG